MTFLLHIKDPQFFRKRSTGKAVRIIDLEVEPCPTVMATGLRSVTCDKYWIEDDGAERVTDQSKPPYRVPSMAEINALEPNGFKIISTFAGCGGSSLGYRMAGFKVLWSSEFIDAARKVYEDNAAPGTIVDGNDIRKVDPHEVMKLLGLKPGDLDVLDGSPPCSSFSTAGKREKKWGQVSKYSDKEQRTDDLFFEYARFVEAFRPKVFVAENVSGLVNGTAKGYFLEILEKLKGCGPGYRVEAQLLDSQWLGVPQTRQRIIFIGVRKDLKIEPAHPTPLPYRYSVRDALPWVTRAVHDTSGQFSSGDMTDRPAPTVTDGVNSVNSNHFQVHAEDLRPGVVVQGPETDFRNKGRPIDADQPAPTVIAGNSKKRTPRQFEVEIETDISGQAIGREYDKLNPGQQSDKYFNLVRSDAAAPAPTITASGGMNSGIACAVHPTEKRKFSIAELKRICAFPDDFNLSGTYGQQWERLGRAVPPVMMFHIASAVRDRVLRRIDVRDSGDVQPSGPRRRRAS